MFAILVTHNEISHVIRQVFIFFHLCVLEYIHSILHFCQPFENILRQKRAFLGQVFHVKLEIERILRNVISFGLASFL